MHVIAGKAVTAEEALTDDFHDYIHQVVLNAKAMAAEFMRLGYDVVTRGTDNHLFLLDFSHTHPNLSGKQIQGRLEENGIAVNKNTVPGETRSPMQTSGIRIGTPAMTTKGWKEDDFVQCARKIDEIITAMTNE